MASVAPAVIASRDPTLELARALIARRSLTPDDAGCQALHRRAPRAARIPLRNARVERRDQPVGAARRTRVRSSASPGTPTSCRRARSRTGTPIRSCRPSATAGCYGRGAADMKSSLAAFVTAIEALRRRASASARVDRAAAHLRRGRPVDRRHASRSSTGSPPPARRSTTASSASRRRSIAWAT